MTSQFTVIALIVNIQDQINFLWYFPLRKCSCVKSVQSALKMDKTAFDFNSMNFNIHHKIAK